MKAPNDTPVEQIALHFDTLNVAVSFRWIYLNDQNLCIPATSSFVYGAVPIGASIYVIGELDTGQQLIRVYMGASLGYEF